MEKEIKIQKLENIEDLGALLVGDIIETNLGKKVVFSSENNHAELIGREQIDGSIITYTIHLEMAGEIISGELNLNPLTLKCEIYYPAENGYLNRTEMLKKVNLENNLKWQK